MIRVGFIGFSGEWQGGQNYLRNLLYAISQIKPRSIEPVVFLGTSVPQDVIDLYKPHAKVVLTPFLERYHWVWWFAKASCMFGQGQWAFEDFLIKNDIYVLFSTPGLIGYKRIKALNWIPDFQHKYLKDLSNSSEIALRDKSFQVAVTSAARIILSSQDALKDLTSLAPQAVSKTRVLHFVGQVDPQAFSVSDNDIQRLKEKYSLPAKFIYLPNQFWKHKNHLVVFKAVDQLKTEGLEIPVVCSGALHDYRNVGHIEDLKRFISDHQLDKDVMLLGKIPLSDVFLMYVASFAVINPSLFEGWSTTVEECKTLGKRILLSDIPVHYEQAPLGGVYFDPLDPKDAAAKLKQIWTEENKPIGKVSSHDLQEHLHERTLEFATGFQDIVEEVIK